MNKIKQYAYKLFSEQIKDTSNIDISDFIEELDKHFYQDFCSQYIDLDYNDNNTRDIFRSEIRSLYLKLQVNDKSF